MKTTSYQFSIILFGLLAWSCYSPQGSSKAVGSPEVIPEISGKIAAEVQAVSSDTLFSFGNYPVGQTPAGWAEALTGRGKVCRWEIVNDQGNKVLAQLSSETPDYRFNLIVNNTLSYKNVEISVRFKGVKGRGDQGGGPVWRYQDANNYYVARANPLENNFRLYKVVNGSRHMLKSASLRIDTGKWYTLKITMQGNRIKCYFNGKPELEATDNSFPQAGKAGLWTKSDAVTYFDDFKATPIPGK